MSGSSSSVEAAASVRASGVAREERRRHRVDPLVRALGREDGRDEELERVAERELGERIGMLLAKQSKTSARDRGRRHLTRGRDGPWASG